MAIEFSNLGSSGSPDFVAGSGSSYQSPSWTPPSSGVILLVIENSQWEGFNDPPAVSGNGLTWVRIGTMTYEYDEGIQWDLSRLSLYAANASGSSPGQTTISFLDSQDRCEASFFHATGIDLSGGVTGAFRSFRTGLGYASSAQINLASPASSNNRPIAAFAHRINAATTPRTNWTEMDDLLNGATVIGLETQVRQDAFDTAASASWGSAAEWGGIAVELKAPSSGTPVPVFVHHLKQQGIG